MSKAPESAPGFKAASRPNQDAGASGASSPRAAAPNRDNGVTAANCDLLLLRCPNTRLDAHGGGSETRADLYLERTGMSDCKPYTMTVDTQAKFSSDMGAPISNQTAYRGLA
jgi:hypothetical protein